MDEEIELSSFDEAKLASLRDEVEYNVGDNIRREMLARIRTGTVLPPSDPREYSDHGMGCGPLDGQEDWAQFWGPYDLVTTRRSGGGFIWKVRGPKETVYPIAATGEVGSMEEAGMAILDWCRQHGVGSFQIPEDGAHEEGA